MLADMAASRIDKRVEEVRKCGKCGADAVCVSSVTTHTLNSGYSGRTYRHRCEQCKSEFTSVSLLRLVVRGFLSALFIGGGAGAVLAFAADVFPIYDQSIQGLAITYGISVAMAVGGVICAVPLVRSVVGLARNPIAVRGG
jgi:hypothetical protein